MYQNDIKWNTFKIKILKMASTIGNLNINWSATLPSHSKIQSLNLKFSKYIYLPFKIFYYSEKSYSVFSKRSNQRVNVYRQS